jgi:membrane-associated phospholipid phosphatase
VFNAISLTGSPIAMGTLALVVAILLARQRRWIVLSGWVAAFVGGAVLDWALKLAIARPRPSYGSAFLHGQSFSFPSGHAMGSLIGFGMLAYLLITFRAHYRRARIWIIAIAAVWTIAIGFSRLYLGVHYFSDVVGGYAAGVVWLAVCISGVEVARRQRIPATWEVGLDRRRVARPAVGA